MKRSLRSISKNILLSFLFLTICLSAFSQLRNPMEDTRFPSSVSIKTPSVTQPNATFRDGEVEINMMLGEYQIPYGISPDGTKAAIAHWQVATGFYWAYPDEMEVVDGYVYDVSNAGRVCGSFFNEQNYRVAGYWENGEWTFLGMHPDVPQFFDGEDYSSIWAMSSDGNILAGMQYTEAWTTIPFTWTEAGGYVNLEQGSGYACRPNAICDDGSIVGGWSADPQSGVWQPCIWINGVMTILHQSDSYGEVYGISRNGQYVCGYCGEGSFLWTAEDGFQILDDFGGTAVSVGNDGTVLGYGWIKPLNAPSTTFQQYAISRGWAEAANWSFTRVCDVSENGNTFIFSGATPDGAEGCFRVNFSSDIIKYSLELLVDPEGTGVANGAGEYAVGTQITISATANSGYQFVNWTDEEGNIISSSVVTTVTIPENDLVLTAHFEPVLYTLTLLLDDEWQELAADLVLSGAGEYAEGTEINIEASEMVDFICCDYWSNEAGDTVAEYCNGAIIMPSDDLTLTMHYVWCVGIEEENSPVEKIYPNPVKDWLTIELKANHATVQLIDVQGRIVYQTMAQQPTLQIDTKHFADGLYLLRTMIDGETFTTKIVIQP